MNRPIFIVVIGYVIGIVWGLYLKMSIVPFYIVIITIHIIIKLPYSKRKFRIFSIKRYFRYIKIFFKTSVILTIIISSFISNMIIKFQENKYNNLFQDKEELELIGIIVSNKQEKEYYNIYKIKLVTKEQLYIKTNKNIKLEYGDKVQIKGIFQMPEIARNYKGFNYKQYLKTQKIFGTIKASNVKILSHKCGSKLLYFSNFLFLKIKSNIENTYNENISGVVLGIMLGYTEQIDDITKQDFSSSSISHVLAVSGLHISYIIIIVSNSTKKIFGKKKSKVIVSIILLIYMFITGCSISVSRACIMGILTCMSFVFYRKSDTLNNISISALIILINNPYSLINMSFLLTYGGTIGIIYIKPIIEKILKTVKIRNRKYKYIYLRIQKKFKKILELMAVSISAQLITAPIVIINYNSIGMGFLLTNLLLSLVIGVIVAGGFIQIIVSFISIKGGESIAKLIEIPISLLLMISKIQIGNYKVITPDFYQIFIYYILIFSFRYFYIIFNSKTINQTQKRIKNTIYLIKYKLRPHSKKIIYSIIIFSLIVNIFCILKSDLKIYFVDVGQGDCTFVVTPNNKKILIDGGGSYSFDGGEKTLLPYLLARKTKTLDYIIISHFDEDHVLNLFTILSKLKVKNVIIGKQFDESKNYTEFLNLINEKNINVHVVESGQRVNIEKDLHFDILWPDLNCKVSKNVLNNNSLVCKLVYKDFSMLFTGDIEEVAEKSILQKYKNNISLLNSTVLKVAHHGSKTSSTKEFLEAVNPKIALIGVGKSNTFGHPSSITLERLDVIGCKSYRTDKNGEITIKVNKKGKIWIDKIKSLKCN